MPIATDDPFVPLSTSDAAILLGVSRKTTHRMCQTPSLLPPGWQADKAHRAQGERWVIYVPKDDPRLARLDVPPTPTGETPVPDEGIQSHLPTDYEHPYTEPLLTVPQVREQLLAPLIQHLADVDGQATTRWEALVVVSEKIGRFQVLMEVAQQQVRQLEIDLERATSERLALVDKLGYANGEIEQLHQALQAERDGRMAAEAALLARRGLLARIRGWLS